MKKEHKKLIEERKDIFHLLEDIEEVITNKVECKMELYWKNGKMYSKQKFKKI